MKTTKALLGGGCFWCLDAAFRELRGVQQVVSGYAGGARPHPTYEQICTGATGHAEVVEISFDPEQIRYRELLEIFFALHDPTSLNRQGHDVGTQYRSVIFWQDEVQKSEAETLIRELTAQNAFTQPIVTELSPAAVFYPAETYHQDYFANNPGQGYCQMVIAPKLTKFRQRFSAMRQT